MPEQTVQDEGGTEREVTEDEFRELLRRDGVTIDDVFYATRGVEDDAPVYKYRPMEVNGFDAIRRPSDESGGDSRKIVGSKVANHDAALIGEADEDEVEAARDKYRDGFGLPGPAVVSEPTPEEELEPLTDEEVLETVRTNFEEHGFFAEDDDGDAKVVSLVHPRARLMGYITGSHVKALPADMTSVDEYRLAVFEALVETAATPDDELADLGSPDDVPVATSDLMETFEESGNAVDEDTRELLSKQVSDRWDRGDYDHLRTAPDEDEL